jgi:Complex I intermediate-associated protein 30 (CIA30)
MIFAQKITLVAGILLTTFSLTACSEKSSNVAANSSVSPPTNPSPVASVNPTIEATTTPSPEISPTPTETTNISTLPPAPEGYTADIIDDLEDGDRINQLQGNWFTYNDQDQGGDSQITPDPNSDFLTVTDPTNPTTKYAQMTGKVTTTFAQGFVGMGTALTNDNTQPKDISNYDAIEFWAKGDGKPYQFKVHSALTVENNDFIYEFTPTSEWQHYVIKFQDLKQAETAKVINRKQAVTFALNLQWQTVGQPLDSVNIAVDNIRLLKSK